MSRLVAFGCSFTYGHGLKDCYKPPNRHGPFPSKTAWPATLGKLLNVDTVINKGSPGASNKLIWKTVLDFDFQQDDIVFINWSYPNRYCIFEDFKNKHIPIGPWFDNKQNKVYYKQLYTDVDHIIDFFNRSDHVKRYLDSLKIKNFHAIILFNKNPIKIKPNWYSVDILKSCFLIISQNYPLGLDNAHPNQAAHDHYANDLFLEIKDKL